MDNKSLWGLVVALALPVAGALTGAAPAWGMTAEDAATPAAAGGPAVPAAPPAAPADVLSVSGTRLLRNGQPFEMHGVEIDAFNAPKDWFENPDEYPNAALTAAYNHFGQAELQYAKQFGANTIVFQVSQMGLDPQNTEPSTAERVAHSAGYVKELASGVQLTRSLGFVVMLSIADTRFSGDGSPLGLANAGTARAAVQLATLFKGDRGLIIEALVEPYSPLGTTVNSPRRGGNSWDLYINGGSDARGNSYVGVNSIIHQMRAAGSANLIVVDGVAENFGAYQAAAGDYPYGAITDSAQNELMFGVHPYFSFKFIGTTPTEWDASFGRFAARHPLVVSEWNQNATKVGAPPVWCEPPPRGKGAPINAPLQFLHYLKDRQINGAVGWAFDMPRTLITNYGAGTPSTMEGAACDTAPGGIGVWLQDYFKGQLPPV